MNLKFSQSNDKLVYIKANNSNSNSLLTCKLLRQDALKYFNSVIKIYIDLAKDCPCLDYLITLNTNMQRKYLKAFTSPLNIMSSRHNMVSGYNMESGDGNHFH